MMKYTLLKSAGLVLAAGIVAGCATAPTQEMSDARQAVQAARDAGAAAHTPDAMKNAEKELSQAEQELSGRNYKNARNDAVAAKQAAIGTRNMALAISEAKDAITEADKLGALTPATYNELAKAEAASAAGNEQEAVRASQQAKQLARDDIQHLHENQQRSAVENQAWLDKTKPLLDEAQQAAPRLSSLQQEALRRAQEAYQQGEGQKAYNLADFVATQARALPPVVPVPAVPPKPEIVQAKIQQYQVLKGDTLWRIAAKDSVYRNPLWWPLIYRSNYAQIHDPDNLNVGQTLTIELNPDDASVNAAVKFAKRREGTPDVVKKMDEEYLRAAEGK